MPEQNKVRKLAYWLYLLRGKKSGNDLENWLKAEKTVECFEDFVAKTIKYASLVVFVLITVFVIAYFVLPLLGYQVSIQKIV